MKRIIPCLVLGLALTACGSATTTSTADDGGPGAPAASIGASVAPDDTTTDDTTPVAAADDAAPTTDAPAADDRGADPSSGDGASAAGSADSADGGGQDEPAEPAAAPASDEGDATPAAEPEAADAAEPDAEAEPEVVEEPESVDAGPPHCADNPYFSEKDDNCSRANYQNPPKDGRLLDELEALYGSRAKANAVNDCLQKGGLPYYNPDAPGGSKTSCTTNGAANHQPLGLSDQRGTLLPFPDYDPTVGSADTPIECAWGAAQEIIQKAKHLTQGKPNIGDNVISKFNPQYANCR